MSYIFEIEQNDKECFVQALYTILNFDRNYPDEERDFVYQSKVLLNINNFQPFGLDDEEKDLIKIINKIQNKDLISYLFLIAEEAEKKQKNKDLYRNKLQNVINKLSPEIQDYINHKNNSKQPFNILDSHSINEITKKTQNVIAETKEIGKNLFNKILKKSKK